MGRMTINRALFQDTTAFLRISILAVGLITSVALAGQNDHLVYVLTKAYKLPVLQNPEQDTIEVAFGESFPQNEALLEDAGNWLVRSQDVTGKEIEYKPISVKVDAIQYLVYLK